MRLDFAYDSFVGRRDENQDATLQIRITDKIIMLGVADGMGGVRGGKMASHLTIRAIENYIGELSPSDFSESSLKNILEECYVRANKAISEAITERPEYKGMGSTLCILLIYHDKYAWANIGDSRIYKIGKDRIKQLTVDHTYLQEHYGNQEGEIPVSVKKQYEHYLTRNLDGANEKPDIFPKNGNCEKLHVGESFMLCSDGLVLDKMNGDFGPYASIIRNSSSTRLAVKGLIEYAFKAGSKDNIAVSLLNIQSAFHFSSHDVLSSKFSRISLYGMLMLALGMSTFFFYQTFTVGSPNSLIVEDQSLVTSSLGNTETSINWKPLKQFDYQRPVRPDYHIYWLAYPDLESVKTYHILVSRNNRMIDEKEVSASERKIQIKDLKLEFDVQYDLQINAILGDDTVIEGNSVVFKVEEER